MSFHNFSGILCAVGMFLFGIDIMSDGLKRICGERMKKNLAVCTKNRLLAVLTSFAVTAIIQSSSAVTVMAVSFIDCGAMSLSQSIGIIMGANIGTTVTSLLLTVNFSAVAPLAVFIGTAMKLFSKKEKVQSIGLSVCGFGFLFVAMSSMSSYLAFFSENESALQAIHAFSGSKITDILIGFIITAVMQSSSATIGVLQSAVSNKLIGTKSAVYILFGQNIGAVIPTLLSAARANREAKKAAVVHLLFNFFGTVIFIIISEALPYIQLLEKAENGALRVSAAHIIFNVVSTVILLPFADRLAHIAERIVGKGRTKAS